MEQVALLKESEDLRTSTFPEDVVREANLKDNQLEDIRAVVILEFLRSLQVAVFR